MISSYIIVQGSLPNRKHPYSSYEEGVTSAWGFCTVRIFLGVCVHEQGAENAKVRAEVRDALPISYKNTLTLLFLL